MDRGFITISPDKGQSTSRTADLDTSILKKRSSKKIGVFFISLIILTSLFLVSSILDKDEVSVDVISNSFSEPDLIKAEAPNIQVELKIGGITTGGLK